MEKFISYKKLQKITGKSRTTLWRMSRNNELPKPYQISLNSVGFKESEIEEWLGNLKKVGE